MSTTATTGPEIRFPNGLYFVRQHPVETLFRPGGTAAGTWKPTDSGRMFYKLTGRPWFCVVRHADATHATAHSAILNPDGSLAAWLLAGLSSADQATLGDPAGWIASREFWNAMHDQEPQQ